VKRGEGRNQAQAQNVRLLRLLIVCGTKVWKETFRHLGAIGQIAARGLEGCKREPESRIKNILPRRCILQNCGQKRFGRGILAAGGIFLGDLAMPAQELPHFAKPLPRRHSVALQA